MGTRNAAVFPEPVRAMAATSTPARMSGMVLRWIGVGTRYPLWRTPRYTSSQSPMDSNPPDLAFLLPPDLDFLLPPPADFSRFGRRGDIVSGSAAASMADEEEDLGFLVGFDLAGVKRAMGWDVGREERRERCGFSRLGLYQCRPRRRGAAEGGGRERERRGEERRHEATCATNQVGSDGLGHQRTSWAQTQWAKSTFPPSVSPSFLLNSKISKPPGLSAQV